MGILERPAHLEIPSDRNNPTATTMKNWHFLRLQMQIHRQFELKNVGNGDCSEASLLAEQGNYDHLPKTRDRAAMMTVVIVTPEIQDRSTNLAQSAPTNSKLG